ncbi:hypothetical protein GOODEAATRI_001545 [Goodea atripinnis]|uniref:Uncharacterized protein n=1 Tax=Goodea atripinnis TaxID=208336 RepID=A0ABV0MFA5_9TELE
MSLPRPDEFKPPPECPVFEPSWEEFRDPYAFINKIRPIAEKTGICKVRPPPVNEGGFDIVCQDRRWTKIAVQMGFSPGKAVGSHLRGHYERILYPYNLFQSGANLLCVQKPNQPAEDMDSNESKLQEQIQRPPATTPDACPSARRAKRMKIEVSYCLAEKPIPILVKQEPVEFKEPIIEADKFKSRYKKMIPLVPPSPMVPMELVEKEFWRLVGAIEEDVTVEYGADIASKEFGSGFPIPNGKFKVSPADEQLEKVMKKLAPELFESQPDLLHQLVTIMNPNTLMAHGVPIYRTNQCAGEFVITQCVDHYRLLHRYNVFSHDEMVCNMATKADTLSVVLASAVHKDLGLMIKEEQELRDKVKKMVKTTCYLSAITCPCSPGVLVCLYHINNLCSCPISNYILNYRYTMDDLFPMMNAVKQRAELYDEWASRVTETLEAKLEKKKGLPVFRSLLAESESRLFPDNDLLRRLRLVTQDAEKCASVAQQLLNGKKQTRYRCGTGKSRSQLTVEELSSFVRQLYNLCCSLPQAPQLKVC